MYKLFINGIQIGNYKTMKMLLESALNKSVLQNGVKSLKWEGKSLVVRTW